MKNKLLKKEEWEEYFDLISKTVEGQHIKLEVAGLDIGDQIEGEWILFDGISYDPKEETLYVHSPSIEHPIRRPTEVIIAEEDGAIKAIQVKDSKSHFQILQFQPPLKPEVKSEKQAPFVNDSPTM